MKEKLFWICMIVVVLMMIGNFLYFSTKQMKEPIFLEHYIAAEVFDENDTLSLTLYYITNKYKPILVTNVSIQNTLAYPSENIDEFWHTGQPSVYYHQEFTHHYLVPITIEIPAISIPFEDNKTWTFNTIEVFYSNGSSQTVSVGEVILSKYDGSKINSLINTSVSGGSDGFGSEFYSAEESLEITSFDHPFSGKVNDQVAIKISTSDNNFKENTTEEPEWLKKRDLESWNSVEGILLTDSLKSIQIEKGEWLRVYTQTRPNYPSILSFPIDIRGVTKTGNEFHVKAYVNDDIYLEEETVKSIISKKQAGDNE
jgi:hypothetical protein